MDPTTSPSPPAPPPYALAAVVAAGILLLYGLTLAPTTQFWDTSEYIAAAKVMGIPHPPGNPLFVLLANAWGQLPLGSHYALRINLFAAVTSALASGLLFLVADRFLQAVIPHPAWARRAAAAAGVLVGATSFTVWNQSVVNEKVYTVSLLSIALVLWLVVRWADEPAGGRRDRWLVLIAYLLALTTTNHLMGLLAAPAVAVYVLARDPSVFLRRRVWAAGIVAVVVGLSVNAVLPIRAAHLPPINEGEPVCESVGGTLASIYTMGKAGCPALSAVLTREQYQKPPLTNRQAPLRWQLGNYAQYFSWQFAHDLGPTWRTAITVLFLVLGLAGAGAHWQRDRTPAVAMTALMATVTVLLVFYLNFKYGFSLGPGEPREVRERDYFFVVSFHLWGIWVALGLGTLWAGAAWLMTERVGAVAPWGTTSPVLLFALLPLVGNHYTASRAGEYLPRDFARDLLESVEPYGILISGGDNDTFPLWYAQEVEGIRPDVLVATISLMNTTWHIKQLRRRPIVPFDSANAIAPYRGRAWPHPDSQPIGFTEAEIDALLPFFSVPERRAFVAGQLRATIEPGFLMRSDVVTLELIQRNLGARPVYISRTSGAYGEELGLGPFLLGQGLVRKIMPDTVRASENVVRHPSLGWIDLARTRELMFDVYRVESAARPRPNGWVDIPSEGIISLYGALYAGVADVLVQGIAEGRLDAADTVLVGRAADYADQILRQTSFYWLSGP